jgi:hypothetical protein
MGRRLDVKIPASALVELDQIDSFRSSFASTSGSLFKFE